MNQATPTDQRSDPQEKKGRARIQSRRATVLVVLPYHEATRQSGTVQVGPLI
jgi:hypothetical protein